MSEKQVDTLKKKFKTVIDVNAIPAGMTPTQWVKLADTGYIFYDSEKGNRPKLFTVGTSMEDVEMQPEFIDSKGKEVSLEEIQKTWEENNFWDKELYKCKHSPLHYFSNYLSTNPKPTQAEIDEYLKTLGLAASADSEDGMKEDAKQARMQFSDSITLEHLQSLKPVRDAIKAEYDNVTEIYKEEAKVALDAIDTEALSKKIITTIMKTPSRKANTQLKEYVDERTFIWDKQMLRAIDFDVLVRLWKTL